MNCKNMLQEVVYPMTDIGRPEKLVLAVIALAMAIGTAAWLVKALRPAEAEGFEAMEPAAGTGAEPEKAADAGGVVVHVTGAVARPGVYRLASGSRVHDAVQQAGGALPNGFSGALNLAAVLSDGERIDVPVKTDAAPLTVAPPGLQGAAGKSVVHAPSKGTSGRVNLNTATLQQLDALPGVGPSIAARIIEYRQKEGPFRTVEQLLEVPGIGPKKMEALRDLVTAP